MTDPQRPRTHRPPAPRAPAASTLAALALVAFTVSALAGPAAAQYTQPAATQPGAPGAAQMAPQASPRTPPETTPEGGSAAAEGSAPAQTPAPEAQAGPGEGGPAGLGAALGGPTGDPLRIEGEYDVAELRRLLELARESGFSEEEVRQITVEDENGNVVNAVAFLEAYEKRKREREAALAAERAKVYLAPQDIIEELDEQQPEDLDKLRERMLFVE